LGLAHAAVRPRRARADFRTPEARARARVAAIAFAAQFPAAFPICGTLLGMIREGDVIAHDRDVDFGCVGWPHTPMPDRVPGFSLIRRYHLDARPCEVAYRHDATGVKVDLFLFFDDAASGERFFAIYPDEFPKRRTIIRRFPASLFEWCDRHVWGHSFRFLRDPELFLESNYGPTWRVRDEKFRYV